MKNNGNFATLPMEYDTYIFDLYGTLVDIHTDEHSMSLWGKVALVYAYYGATYGPEELNQRFGELIHRAEVDLKQALEEDPHYSHEASADRIKMFSELFCRKRGNCIRGINPAHRPVFLSPVY